MVGLTFADAFTSLVLGDPEVEALVRHATRRSADYEQIFAEYRSNVPEGQDLWPAVHEKHRLIVGAAPEPDEAVVNAAAALTHRYGVLIDSLRRGAINAEATEDRLGQIRTVPRTIWSNERVWLDVRTGDLFEVETAQTPWQFSRRWSGITLSAPQPGHAAAKPTGKPQQRRLSPKQASIEAAVNDIWPNGVPAELTINQRDDQIIKWQQAHDLAVAHPKTISRYFRSVGS
jgi:hypothetical protein